MRKTRLRGVVFGAALMAAAIVPTGAAATSAQPKSSIPLAYDQTTMKPIPTNHVSAGGVGGIAVHGNTADVLVTVSGLLDGVPHAMQIAVDGKGTCPGEEQATDLHKGRFAVSMTNGMPDYGLPGAALTKKGSTNPANALKMDLFSDHGTIRYKRTIHLAPAVKRNIMNGTAVLLVLGIDWNHNGHYDGTLSYSRLAPSLPREATAPALCGVLPADRT